MITPLVRKTILQVLAAVGSQVRMAADPDNYSAEYRNRARRYDSSLLQLRSAWKKIAEGADPVSILLALIVNGIEENSIRLILLALIEDEKYWVYPAMLSMRQIGENIMSERKRVC